MLSEFGKILVFIVGSILFVSIALVVSYLIRPKRPNPEKLTTYECGEEPVGSAWRFFNIRFYIVALIFILFDVEIVFLFPWATVFGQKDLYEATQGSWTWFSILEMFIFIFILGLGLAYVWAKGYLDWVRPAPTTPEVKSVVPKKLYENINQKYSAKTIHHS
jgi:NADH-quinone oxidoreductase subunit A